MSSKLQIMISPALRWGAILLCLGATLRAAPTPPTNSPPTLAVVPLSVFVTNDLVAGKDPFFPNSVRRKTSPGPDPAPAPLGPGALHLRGITTDSAGDRIALINNLTFAKGETLEVRAGDTRLKVTCVEILDKSVRVKIEGEDEQHELVLPEKTLPTNSE